MYNGLLAPPLLSLSLDIYLYDQHETHRGHMTSCQATVHSSVPRLTFLQQPQIAPHTSLYDRTVLYKTWGAYWGGRLHGATCLPACLPRDGGSQ